MIHKSHCDTRIHCVSCRANPKAFDAPRICPYGMTAKNATTKRGGVKMTAEEIKAEEAAFHLRLKVVSRCCAGCTDNDDCVFRTLSSCKRKSKVRERTAKCPMNKWMIS